MRKLNIKKNTEIILISVIALMFAIFISIQTYKYFAKAKGNKDSNDETLINSTPISDDTSITKEATSTPKPTVLNTTNPIITTTPTVEVTQTPTLAPTITPTLTPTAVPTQKPTQTPIEIKPTEAERAEFLSECKRLFKNKDYLAVLEHVNNGFTGKFKNDKDLFAEVNNLYEYSVGRTIDYYYGDHRVQDAIDLCEIAMQIITIDYSSSLEYYYGVLQKVKVFGDIIMRWKPNSKSIEDGGILEVEIKILNNTDKVLKHCTISLAHYNDKAQRCDININPSIFIEGEPYYHYQKVELNLNLQPGESYTYTKVIHNVDKITLPTYLTYHNPSFNPKACMVLPCIESYTLSDGIIVLNKQHNYWYKVYVNKDQGVLLWPGRSITVDPS